MAAFTYRALDSSGAISKGVLEGDSERHVRQQLRQKQLQPIEVSRASGQRRTVSERSSSYVLPPTQLTIVTRQLATLVTSGIPLEEALGATARQAESHDARNLLMQIRSQVLAGQSFAGSLAAFDNSFPRLYRSMVRAGEHAGRLGLVLEQLADYNERRTRLQQQINMALIYPLVLVLIATGVITLLMLFVMPEMVSLFEKTDTALPLLTRILIGLSRFLGSWWWLLLLLIVLGVAGLRVLLRSERRVVIDRMLLRLPLIGRVATVADTSRFASTLSILVQSGVALPEAIAIAAEVMNNTVLRETTATVAVAVEEGGSLARSLDKCGFFPPMLLQLVASGEGAGSLEHMLDRAARTQEEQLQIQLSSLVKVLEPVIILLMALIVGAIVMAVLLPVMQMNTLVS